MNGDDMKCGECKFYLASGTDHGTCHVSPPGHNGGRGFPVIGVRDWCGEFAIAGIDFLAIAEERVAAWMKATAEEQATVRALTKKLGQLIDRPWWQRLLNVIPWGEK